MNFGTLFKISKFAVANYGLGWFCAVWAVVILTPLIYFPAPIALAGHPWKVELVTSFILFLVLFSYLLRKNNFALSIPPKILYWVIMPICGLILWSATSVFWANSTLSVVHHTLVWVCYLIFFILAINIASNKKLFTLFAVSLSIIVGIIATLCIVEYTFSEQITQLFTFRYGRFAEIHAALLPFFFSFLLRWRKKNLILASIITSLVWLAILFSNNRISLLATIIGLFIFISLRIITKTDFTERKRLIIAVLGIVLIAGFSQIHIFSSTQKVTSLTRLTSNKEEDKTNSIQQNVRLLFNKVGLEMFESNTVVGVGADNFGLEFNKYRADFSANDANKATAEQQEALLPERAHNEYLQILTELGIVGGIIFLVLIFGIAKLGFSEIKVSRFSCSSLLTHAAIAGIISFLITSAVTSYSFRLMQNGLVFFFLLALLLRNYVINKPNAAKFSASPNFRLIFAPIAIILCLSLTIFSALKATSQYFVYQAEHQPNLETAKDFYGKAMFLDPANGSANYSLGFLMFQENNYAEASKNFQIAINKGLNTSVCYSLLSTNQTLANDEQAARKTFTEAIKIYPYSTFLRVRYALALKKFGKDDESENQFNIAKQLNSRQAETWRIFINEGEEVTREKTETNKELVQYEDLDPQQAIFAVATERQILHPEEREKFIPN